MAGLAHKRARATAQKASEAVVDGSESGHLERKGTKNKK
jgi:hypothetical protein